MKKEKAATAAATRKKFCCKKVFSRIPRPLRQGILLVLWTLALCATSVGILVLTVSGCMKSTTWDCIMDAEAAASVIAAGDYDCILVLGAGVRADGTPTPMLYDRVSAACAIYTGDIPLLMSGDHTGDYNEVGAMKSLAVEKGVESHDIFLDHEGYSTYESILRAKEKFGAERLVIVSQGYHLHRALFIAREMGLEAIGVTSDLRDYQFQTKYELRELLARFKDFFVAIADEDAPPVGDKIDLGGDGNAT